jgi:N-methylhydantoinase A/oxoprolinase/acetone carboxylase beta subunit
MLSVRDSSYHLAEFLEDQYCCVHRKGGPLAVTDANLLLGRLVPEYFPKIFGKTEKEPLDVEASRTAFEKLAEEINATQDKKLSLDDIVYGFVALLCLFSVWCLECIIQVHQGRKRDDVQAYSCTNGSEGVCNR